MHMLELSRRSPLQHRHQNVAKGIILSFSLEVDIFAEMLKATCESKCGSDILEMLQEIPQAMLSSQEAVREFGNERFFKKVFDEGRTTCSRNMNKQKGSNSHRLKDPKQLTHRHKYRPTHLPHEEQRN